MDQASQLQHPDPDKIVTHSPRQEYLVTNVITSILSALP